MSTSFTCNACKLEFESSELQRAHMHTDYHGYNLKRKIASLAPISAELFDRTVTKSKNGPKNITKLEEAKDLGSLDSEPRPTVTERDYTPTQCLFCNMDSPTIDNNFDHMLKAHGTFIPNQDDLEDPQGLLSHLSHIISAFHECLYCGKTKQTVEGIRSHMVDKGHCRIAVDDEEELDQFYDFDDEIASDDDDDDDDDGVDEADVAEDETVAETDESSPPREHELQPDGEHELHLPSGRILGHRSLSRYYRQNLHSYPTAPAEHPASSSRVIAIAAADGDDDSSVPITPGRQLANNARSEMGMLGVGEAEKRALRVREKKALKREGRARSRYEWRVNREANHQRHYRPANPGPANG